MAVTTLNTYWGDYYNYNYYNIDRYNYNVDIGLGQSSLNNIFGYTNDSITPYTCYFNSDSSYLFTNSEFNVSLQEITSRIKMGLVTNAYRMFFNCRYLKGYPEVSRGVQNASQMYYNCRWISGITPFDYYYDNKQWENLTNTAYMFSGCNNITGSIYMHTRDLRNASNMFLSCYNLNGEVEITDSGANRFNNAYSMFSYTNISEAYVVANGLEDARYMFANCTNCDQFEVEGASLTNCYGMFMNKLEPSPVSLYVRQGGTMDLCLRNNDVRGRLLGNDTPITWTVYSNNRGYYNNTYCITVWTKSYD